MKINQCAEEEVKEKVVRHVEIGTQITHIIQSSDEIELHHSHHLHHDQHDCIDEYILMSKIEPTAKPLYLEVVAMEV